MDLGNSYHTLDTWKKPPDITLSFSLSRSQPSLSHCISFVLDFPLLFPLVVSLSAIAHFARINTSSNYLFSHNTPSLQSLTQTPTLPVIHSSASSHLLLQSYLILPLRRTQSLSQSDFLWSYLTFDFQNLFRVLVGFLLTSSSYLPFPSPFFCFLGL